MQAWAIFLSYYLENSKFSGATHLEYALIGGLSLSMALFSSPVVAASMRVFGTTITLAAGTVLIFCSLFTASYADQIWQLFLSQGLCFGFGMGFLYIPATAVLPQWFSTKRSLAVGIATSGAGLGGVAYNLVAGAAIRSLGIESTYRLLALCALAANALSTVLIKDRDKTVKPNKTLLDLREFGHIEVLLVIAWGFLCELGYVVLLYSLPHYATTVGLTQSQGSVVGAILNVGISLGRPCVGYLSDRYGRLNVACFMTASCGVFCLALWIPANGFALLVVFALLAGLGCGTFWGTVSAVTVEVVGLQRLPTAFGVICLSLVTPTLFAEPIGLEMVGALGYLTSKVFVGCMFLLGASSIFILRSWLISELEKESAQERDNRFRGYAARSGISLGMLAPRNLFKLCRV